MHITKIKDRIRMHSENRSITPHAFVPLIPGKVEELQRRTRAADHSVND